MININNILWRIAFVSADDIILMRPDGSYSIGVCDNNLHIIFINEQLNGLLLKKVLCHELTHAAMFSYNISLTIEQEEILAELIATYGEEIIDITNKIFNKLKERVA